MQVTGIEQFIDLNMNAVDQLLAEIMRAKGASNAPRALSYLDIQAITAKLKGLYRVPIGLVPPQIKTACSLAELLLAPSTAEKKKIMKRVASISGGMAGLGMIIGGIGTALGWGASVIAIVAAFFADDVSLLPFVFSFEDRGERIATILRCFTLKKNDPKIPEKAMNALKRGIRGAIPSVWAEHQEKILAFDYSQK